MTTPDPESRREAWIAERTAAGVPAETWKPVPKIGRCTYSGYEASDLGQARSLDRIGRNGKPLQGRDLSGRLHEDGYVLIDMKCDNPEHRAHTLTMHKVVLTTFDRPRPRGMEACHGKGGPADNRWPEGVRWGTKPENEADKETPYRVVPDPTHPCRNAADGCPNLVVREGRRCVPCVEQVGREAADMLRAGKPLQEVGEHFGYTGGEWVYSLAVKHGGYAAAIAEARTQRPPLKGLRKIAARLLKVA